MLKGLKKLRDVVCSQQDDTATDAFPSRICDAVILILTAVTTLIGLYYNSSLLFWLTLLAHCLYDRAMSLVKPFWGYGAATLRVLAKASKSALFAWRDPSSLWGDDRVALEWAALQKRLENPADMLAYHATDSDMSYVNRRRLHHMGYDYRFDVRGLMAFYKRETALSDTSFFGDFNAIRCVLLEISAFYAVIGGLSTGALPVLFINRSTSVSVFFAGAAAAFFATFMFGLLNSFFRACVVILQHVDEPDGCKIEPQSQ